MSIREYSRKTESQPTEKKKKTQLPQKFSQMESQNENYGNQNHHDNTKPWRTRTHRDLQIHHLHGDFKRELKEKHTHTPEAYDDFKHGISKAKENKNNLQSYD
jgi:hypothetical protein